MLRVANYNGFVGLNTNVENFAHYVMSPEELSYFITAQSKFNATYAYPSDVAGGFATAPIFSGNNFEAGVGFNLLADIKTNRRPKNFKQFLGCLFLPRALEAEDNIRYAEDDDKGFGLGTCRIDSIRFTNKRTGKRSWLSEKLLGVQNRPALFLKVFNADGIINTDVAIFFPAQVGGAAHKPVQFGEAFVFVKQGVAITAELKQAILASFNLLVDKSYGADNGLNEVATHTALKL